jgi:hypothetical protein
MYSSVHQIITRKPDPHNIEHEGKERDERCEQTETKTKDRYKQRE